MNTKTDLLRRAKHVWTCQHCHTQHVKGPAEHRAMFSITEKPKYCLKCERSTFFFFASYGEAQRFAFLAMMQNQGEITNLRCQVPLPVKVRNKKIFKYVADFMYFDKTGKRIIEDYKGAREGMETEIFKLKRKLVEAVYQIKITISR